MNRTARWLTVLVLATAGGLARPTAAQRTESALLQRFESHSDRHPVNYRAIRRLEAHNERLERFGWLRAVTEFAEGRLTFRVLDRGGSEFVQKKVLVPVLEAERNMIEDGSDPAAFTSANYRFEELGVDELGLTRVKLTPLRKDKRLLDGWVLLTPDADLVEVSGRLARSPSFWTTSVKVTRRYGRIAGVQVPISMTSEANLRFAGRSTFSMVWDYENVNGVPVNADGTSDTTAAALPAPPDGKQAEGAGGGTEAEHDPAGDHLR
jgi:hypothetical protein